MRRWRLAVLIVPALLLAAFQAAPAAGAPPAPPSPPGYPPSFGSLSVSATVVTAGATVEVWGDGFAPNTVVAISARDVLPITTSTPRRRSPDCRATGQLCVVRADTAGRMTATVRLTRVGTTAIVASGTDPRGAARVLSAVVLVLSRSHRHELAGAGRFDAGGPKAPGGAGMSAGTPASAVATRAAAHDSPAVLPASLAAGAVLLAAAVAVAIRRRRQSTGQ
jgi:hypothetical protein